MDPLTIMAGASIAGSLFSGFSGFGAGKKAAKKAKEIGRLNKAEFERQAVLESDLRTKQKSSELDANARRMGQIEGMYSKSGLMLTGTPAQAIQEQGGIGLYNMGELDEASAERVRSLRMQARLETIQAGAAASAYKAQGQTDLISGFFSAAKSGVQMYSGMENWMGGKKTPGIQAPKPFDANFNYSLQDWRT